MRLLIFYVAFVLIGEGGAYLIGRSVEVWSKTIGLPVFLVCFFAVFWIAWQLAVRASKPKVA